MKKIIDTKQIQEYGFAELLSTVIQSYKDGWELDLESNQNYPVSFGTFYSLGMIKTEEEIEETEEETEEDTNLGEDQEELEEPSAVDTEADPNSTKPRRGRKPKEE